MRYLIAAALASLALSGRVPAQSIDAIGRAHV